MNRRRRTLELGCATAVVAVALLAVPTVQAATGSRPVAPETATVPVDTVQKQAHDSGKSYFWSDAAIVGGVLAGIVALGLWGDVAIGRAIFGIGVLCAGAAMGVRRVSAHARGTSRRAEQVAGSNPATSR